jgi:hypothetical protein
MNAILAFGFHGFHGGRGLGGLLALVIIGLVILGAYALFSSGDADKKS